LPKGAWQELTVTHGQKIGAFDLPISGLLGWCEYACHRSAFATRQAGNAEAFVLSARANETGRYRFNLMSRATCYWERGRPRPPEPKTILFECQVRLYQTKSSRCALSAGEGARAPSKEKAFFEIEPLPTKTI